MGLDVLEGIGESNGLIGIDANDLFGHETLEEELGKLFKKPIVPKRTQEQKATSKQKRRAIGKKVLKVVNKVNKVNPATVVLRAGILASMKLNIGEVAQRIKWGYANREYAQSKGMDMSKYDQLKNILNKTEQIFFASGGNVENLRKAILTGRGNRNHEVQGLEDTNEYMTMPELLGEIFRSEFIEGMEGFQGFAGFVGFAGLESFVGLGEPATATSLAAASTMMGILAALLKSLGELFPKKIAEQASETTQTTTQSFTEETSTEQGEKAPSEDRTSENAADTTTGETQTDSAEQGQETDQRDLNRNEVAKEALSGPLSGIKDFYDNNRSWIVPVGVVVGIGTVAFIVEYYSSKNNSISLPERKTGNLLNGLNKSKSFRKGHRKYYSKLYRSGVKKKIIDLM